MRCAMRGVWAAVAALALLAGTAAAEKQWLHYRVLGDNEQGILQVGYVNCGVVATDAPAGVAMPEFKAGDPCFAWWTTPMAPQGKVLLAFDRSSKRGQYDLLYVDSNCSGSLRDKKPIRASTTYEGGAQFGPVKITLPGEDGPISYHLRFLLQTQGASMRNLFAVSACAYEGSVRIGGKGYHCMLVDYDCNGTFDDISGDFEKADLIRLGANDKAVTYFAGKYVAVDGALYQPKPSRDGAYVEFEPAGDVAMVAVHARNAVTELSLGGENGLFHLADGAGAVPAGRYKLYSWKIERRGADNGNWTLAAIGGRDEAIEVTPGQEAAPDVGEPITCRLDVATQRGSFQFSQSLCGRMDERISIERNGSMPDAPRLQVASKDGAFSKVYKFEYG